MLHCNNPSPRSSILVLAALVVLAASTSCGDPVRDARIDALGPETGVPQGPLHRAGQPCVLCHADGGPASVHPFAVGGTVFATNAADSAGAPNVRVLFIDAASAQRETTTNESGNFFVLASDWPDLTFPFKVGIVESGKPPLQMHSTVNREPSCNFCHQPTPGSPHATSGNDTRESIGQIYLTAAGAM